MKDKFQGVKEREVGKEISKVRELIFEELLVDT